MRLLEFKRGCVKTPRGKLRNFTKLLRRRVDLNSKLSKMPILCSIDGCGVRARKSGTCHKHTLCKCGMQRVRGRTTCNHPGCKLNNRIPANPPCALIMKGSTNLSYARGKCRKHWTAARKRLQCSKHRCSRAAVSAVLGMCYKHSECKLDSVQTVLALVYFAQPTPNW